MQLCKSVSLSGDRLGVGKCSNSDLSVSGCRPSSRMTDHLRCRIKSILQSRGRGVQISDRS